MTNVRYSWKTPVTYLLVGLSVIFAFSINSASGDITFYGGTGDTVYDFAQSPWFSLTSGLASILGVLLSLYPTSIRNVPPSAFRTLIWHRTLLLATGSGITVFGGIQFYQQDYAPPIPWFNLAHLILRGDTAPNNMSSMGPSIWALLLVVGLALLIGGASMNPAARISQLVMAEVDNIRRRQKKHLQAILSDKNYDDLPDNERVLYNHAVQSFLTLEARILEMYTGTSFHARPDPGVIKAETIQQKEEVNSLLRLASPSNGTE